MTDEPVTIPDFLPLELEEEHLVQAREQVHGSHHLRAQLDGPAQRPANAHDPHDRFAGRLSWISASDLPLVLAAAVMGLLGLTALTTWWSWLAMTGDAMWWGFTGVGAVLLGALAWTNVALQSQYRRLTEQRLALAKLAEREPVADVDDAAVRAWERTAG